ncbi:hypothetical protein ACP4OV_024735 [Aristida adscensionis]
MAAAAFVEEARLLRDVRDQLRASGGGDGHRANVPFLGNLPTAAPFGAEPLAIHHTIGGGPARRSSSISRRRSPLPRHGCAAVAPVGDVAGPRAAAPFMEEAKSLYQWASSCGLSHSLPERRCLVPLFEAGPITTYCMSVPVRYGWEEEPHAAAACMEEADLPHRSGGGGPTAPVGRTRERGGGGRVPTSAGRRRTRRTCCEEAGSPCNLCG